MCVSSIESIRKELLKLNEGGPQTQPSAPGSKSTSTSRPIEDEGWPYNMGDRSKPLNPPPTIIPGSLGGNNTPSPAQTGNPMTQQLGYPGSHGAEGYPALSLPPQIGQQQFGGGGQGGIGGGGLGGGGGQTSVSLNLQGSATANSQGSGQNRGYSGYNMAEGGPIQQVTQFQPTYSPAQQGEPQVYEEPPPMEESPQDYNQSPQYAPTQQYSAPASNPMTAGLGSYLEGLKYKAPPPVAPVVAPPPVTDTTSPTIYNPTTQRYETNPSYVTSDDSSEEVPYVGRPIYDDGGDKAGGPIHAYARGGSTPQGIASLGRGQDSMLVHMTPGEVQGLQQLAMRHGGSLTINPQTGLPEAGFLSSVLPMLAGFALGPAGFGLMSSLGAAATVGGIGAIATGSLSKGLMYGLGAYSGSGLGESLSSMGAEQAQGLAGQETAQAADVAGNQARQTALQEEATRQADIAAKFAETDKAAQAAKMGGIDLPPASLPPSFPQTPRQIGELAGKEAMAKTTASFIPPSTSPAGMAMARGPAANAFEGFKQLGTTEGLKTLGGKLGYSGVASLAAPLIASALTPAPFNPPKKPEQYYHTSYNPPKYNPATGAYEPASYGPGSYYTNPTQYAAKGGVIGYDEGGPAFYPLTGDARGPGEKPQYSSDIYGDDSGAGINNNKAGRGSYSDAAGKGIHENTSSGVEELFSKVSPATLARFKTAKNAARQAAAIKELRKRANAVSDYNDEDTVTAAQGGVMRLDIGGSISATATAGGPRRSSGSSPLGGFEKLFSQNPEMLTMLRGLDNYSYNPANQTYSGQGMSSLSSPPAQYSYDPSGQSYAPKMAAGGVFGKLLEQLKQASLADVPQTEQYSYDPNEQKYTKLAQGGLMGLNTYAAGGKLLRGPGDGMSDSIPAVINGVKPQRAALADGEFVMPADVVSHLGNGSTEAGSKRLYAMMDRVRKARTGNPKQGKQINADRFMPA